MRSTTSMLALAIFALVFAASSPAPAQYPQIGYDYYVYAPGGDGIPIDGREVEYGSVFVYHMFQDNGDPNAGNMGYVSFVADVARGHVGSFASSVSGVMDYWPFGFSATGRVDHIYFRERLHFHVPAGTYPSGVEVGLSGAIMGQISSTIAASIGVTAEVEFNGSFWIPATAIGVDEDSAAMWYEPFSLTKEIVAPGVTLLDSHTYYVYMLASIGNNRASSTLLGTSPNYITGNAQGDMFSGIQFSSVDVPPGVTWGSDSGVFLDNPTGVPDRAQASRLFVLEPSYPNPFNPNTTIAFDLLAPAAVDLRVYDVAGRLVRVLLRGESLDAGLHRQTWNGRDDLGREVGTGVYLYEVRSGHESDSRRMTLLR